MKEFLLTIIPIIFSVSSSILVAVSLLIINWLRTDIAKLREDHKDLEKRCYEKDRSEDEFNSQKELLNDLLANIEKVKNKDKDSELNNELLSVLKIINNKLDYINKGVNYEIKD
jgi:DNA-binding transcriptional regulator GbsR (MarR family)